MNAVSLNENQVSFIKSLASTDPVAKEVFSDFSTRLRTRNFVDLRRQQMKLVKTNPEVKPDLVNRVYQRLQEIGLGKLENEKFLTGANIRVIGAVAVKGNADEMPKEKRKRRRKSKQATKGTAPKRKPGRPRKSESVSETMGKPQETGQTVYIPFRGSPIGVKLPNGLTKEEIDTVANYIKQLPFVK